MKRDYTFYPSATVGESNGKTMIVNPYGGLFLKWYDHEYGLGRMEELRRADALAWCKENLPVETGYETLFKILEGDEIN